MVLFLNSKKLLSLRDKIKGGELRTGSKQDSHVPAAESLG